MQTLLQDVRYGLRMLRKTPGLTAVILIMLTLGIGATTAMFTIFDAILLRPLAYEKPDELVQLWEKRTDGPFHQTEFSYPDYLDMKQQNKVFSQMGGYSGSSVTLSGKHGAEQVQAAVATTDFFETLGVRPVLGRTFKAGEDALLKNIPVILTYGAWQRRFGGDASVIGQALVIDGELASVVGVLPKNFVFAPGRSADLWISARLDGFSLRRNGYWLHPVARLKPGVSLQQAQAEIQTLSSRLAMQYPDSNAGVSIGGGQPAAPDCRAGAAGVGRADGGDRIRVAHHLREYCGTVAGTVAASQERNFDPSRTGRRIESDCAAVADGKYFAGSHRRQCGFSPCLLGCPGIISLLPQDIVLSTPQVQGLTVNAGALWFALGISLLTGILFGLAPLFQTSNPNLQQELQDAGRGSVGSAHRLRNVLVISEMALAVVLLVGAGLMLKSLNRVLSTDPGFNPRNLLTGIVALPGNKYPDGPKQLAFQQQLLERINSLPGVEQAGAVTTVPMSSKRQHLTLRCRRASQKQRWSGI